MYNNTIRNVEMAGILMEASEEFELAWQESSCDGELAEEFDGAFGYVPVTHYSGHEIALEVVYCLARECWVFAEVS